MQYLLIIILIISFNLQAKLLKDESPSRIDSCYTSYFQNPLIKEQKEFFSNHDYMHFIQSVDNYCQCEVKSLQREFKEQEDNWIEYAFKNKNEMLMKRDQCAISNFNTNELQLHYQARFIQWFSPQIFSRIDEYNRTGVRNVVNSDQWLSYSMCFHDQVSQKCKKSNSLAVTYQCIKQSFEINSFYQKHELCIKHFAPQQKFDIVRPEEMI